MALIGIIGGTMFAMSSCEGDNGIELDFNQDNVSIVTILPNSVLRLDTTAIVTSNLDSLLAANNATRDDINSIQLVSVDVNLCDSTGADDFNQNFNNWDSVGVSVFVPNDASVPNVFIAQSKVPQNLWGFGVSLTQSDFDFLPYASKQQFAVRLLNKLVSPITTKKYVKVKIRVNISANI